MSIAATELPVAGPVTRYHGSKFKLAPWIISHLPPHRVYVEPYGGGAGVLLRKPRVEAEIYNDIDDQINNVFRVLRDPELSARLEHQLVLTPYSRAEFNLSYEPSDDPVEQARRTILRGFMGMSTRGTSGGHRTGFRYMDRGQVRAHRVWAHYPERLAAICIRMAGVIIEQIDALELIRKIDAGPDAKETLYYCDPPYVLATRQKGGGWQRAYRYELSDTDHIALAELLHGVRGMVALSGYPSTLYDELYGDWDCVTRPHLADGGKPRTECLWLSPSAANRAGRLQFGEG